MTLVLHIDIDDIEDYEIISVYNAENLYNIILNYVSNFKKNFRNISIFHVVGDKQTYKLANIGLKSGNNYYLQLYESNKNYIIDDKLEGYKDEIIEILDRNYFQKSRRIKYALIATVVLAAIGTGGYLIFR